MSLLRGIPKLTRSFTTSAVRRSFHPDEVTMVPGSNLPFRIDNPIKLTALFIVFFGSGIATPFVAIRTVLKKK